MEPRFLNRENFGTPSPAFCVQVASADVIGKRHNPALHPSAVQGAFDSVDAVT